MNYLKQLGYDFIELLLINGARTSRLIFFFSFISLCIISIILCKIATGDNLLTIINALVIFYIAYVISDKRNKDVDFPAYIPKTFLKLFIISFLGFFIDFFPLILLFIFLCILYSLYSLILILKRGSASMNQYGDYPSKDLETLKRLKFNSFVISTILSILASFILISI